MAVDKLVDSTLLDAACTYEAGKIREKLGSSAQIAYDLANGKGFGDAIAAIETGGSGASIDELNNNTLTELESAQILEVRSSLFFNNTSLITLTLPNAVRVNGSGIRNTGLTVFVGPNISRIDDSGIAYNSRLTTVDIKGNSTLSLMNGALRNNGALKTIILRMNGVVSNGGSSVLVSTPFASGGSGGTLYVPSALISSYQSATNWSTILGYANNSIQAIEGSQYENYYADGTPIT